MSRWLTGKYRGEPGRRLCRGAGRRADDGTAGRRGDRQPVLGAARRPLEGWSAYCAGKAGLAMLTRSVHLEYGAAGVQVYGFAPGVVDTGMQGEIRASGMNEVSQIPRAALALADQPARAIAWLCGPQAAGLAGQELDVREPGLRASAGAVTLE
ncbi:MAG: SDR family NAD(P)-dependent oxidoreductase [Exiguobacterium profundum]|nr:MAG: SDR family NAD(P)-dependent oxidoreductase [Exiguobacterium profundum]